MRSKRTSRLLVVHPVRMTESHALVLLTVGAALLCGLVVTHVWGWFAGAVVFALLLAVVGGVRFMAIRSPSHPSSAPRWGED